MLREEKAERPAHKGEERDHPIDPMPSGLLRRRFLAVLDTGSAALAARSARVLASYVQGEEQGSKNGESASTRGKTGGKPTSVQAIEFSDTDELILSEGFYYEFIRSSGNPLTCPTRYPAITTTTWRTSHTRPGGQRGIGGWYPPCQA